MGFRHSNFLTFCCFRNFNSKMYDSLDFNYTECNSIAASTDEIIWSDDETIVADQETLWQEGEISNRFVTIVIIVSLEMTILRIQRAWNVT